MEYKQRIIIAVENGRIRTHLPTDKEADKQIVNYYLGGRNSNVVYAGELSPRTFDNVINLISYNERLYGEAIEETKSLIKKLEGEKPSSRRS